MVLYLIRVKPRIQARELTVISLLHHYLAQHSHGKKCVYLYADNCMGQNKDNGSVQYLVLRVLSGYEEALSYCSS